MSEEESSTLNESGPSREKMQKAQLIARAISQWTGAEYRVAKPTDEYPPGVRPVRWLVVAPHLNQIGKVAHADAIWESGDGSIFVESSELGSLVHWIELEYGEEGAVKALSMDFTKFPDDSIRKVFAAKFELTDHHIRGYEDIFAKVFAKTGVKIDLEFSGGRGSALVYMMTKFEANALSLEAEAKRIKLAIQALSEALHKITRFERRWSKIIG